MCVLQGWVRNVSAGVDEWVSICFTIHSFMGEGGLPVDGAAVVREAVDAEWDEIHAHEM